MFFYAIIGISIACLLYTIGVWAEKYQGKLIVWHLLIFWLGLLFDTVGTTLMSMLAGTWFKLDFHIITGLSAILLMFLHTIWATWVLISNNQYLKEKFHKFSLAVWLIWLIPMISGAIISITNNH